MRSFKKSAALRVVLFALSSACNPVASKQEVPPPPVSDAGKLEVQPNGPDAGDLADSTDVPDAGRPVQVDTSQRVEWSVNGMTFSATAVGTQCECETTGDGGVCQGEWLTFRSEDEARSDDFERIQIAVGAPVIGEQRCTHDPSMLIVTSKALGEDYPTFYSGFAPCMIEIEKTEFVSTAGSQTPAFRMMGKFEGRLRTDHSAPFDPPLWATVTGTFNVLCR